MSTFDLAEKLLRELNLCTLQSKSGFYAEVCAEQVEDGVILTKHEPAQEVFPDAEPDDPAETTGHIELSAEGWRTLVEMYALRCPEAFARVVEKWQAFQRVTQKEVPHA